MRPENISVFETLEHYVKLAVSPGYAVLLSGGWGCGKTTLIKYFCKEHEDSARFVYVSLNGLSKIEEVEREIFRIIHPVLGSKKMEFASQLLKGLLKASFRVDIDLNGDGRTDIAASSALISDLPDWVISAQKSVLIFDDVERCVVGMGELLGYVNTFVEHLGGKCILIAHEEYLGSTEDERKRYQLIKEKLIGRTVKVSAEFDDAFDGFSACIAEDNPREAIRRNRGLVESILAASGVENLRLIRQGFLDFERVYLALDARYRSSRVLIEALVTELLILSIPLRAGRIKEQDINALSRSLVADYLAGKNGEEPKQYDVRKIFSGVFSGEFVLDVKWWSGFLVHGSLDAAALNEFVKNSSYFRSNGSEPWVILWYWTKASDDEFASALSGVEDALKNHEYADEGRIRHLIGIYLFLQGSGIIQRTREEVATFFKSYIDKVASDGRLQPLHPYLAKSAWDDSSFGLQYMSLNDEGFVELSGYLRERRIDVYLSSLPEKAVGLSVLMKSDFRQFCQSLIRFGDVAESFYKLPILNHIDVDAFILNLLDVADGRIFEIPRAIESRYSQFDDLESMREEWEWVISLVDRLAQLAVSKRGSVGGLKLENVESKLRPIASFLQAHGLFLFFSALKEN